ITLKAAGPRQVTVTDTSNAALTASVARVVQPGSAFALAFVGQPGDQSVRAPFGVQVELRDAFSNRVPVGAPTVSLSVNRGATLSGVSTASPMNGVVSFTGLSIAEEDSGYVLTASAPGLAPASSSAFTITDDVPPSAPPLQLSSAAIDALTVGWTAVGDDGMEGAASSYELRYSRSNIVSDAQFMAATPVQVGTPRPSGSAESAVITGLEPGVTYWVALKVTDNAGNSVRTPALMASTPYPTAARLHFAAQPASGTAGQDLASIRVEIQSASGQVVGNATSAVTLTVNGASGSGPFTVAASQGVATFNNIRIDQAGAGYTLVATSGGLTQATSSTFDIAPASASRLELSGLPATLPAGSEQEVTVKVRDAYGNLATSFTGTVSFSSTDPAASKLANYTFTSADQGQHTFTRIVLRTQGSQIVSVSSTGLTSGQQQTTVTAPPPGRLVMTGVPANVRAGDTLSVTVECLDGYNQRDTAYSGTLHFTSSDPRAVLPADAVFTAADAGIKTFTVKLLTPSAQAAQTSLTVTDAANAALTATAATTVKWADPSKLAVEAPDTANAGTPISVEVSVLDAFDNVVKDYVGAIHFAATAASAVLPSDYTYALSDEGVRSFGVTLRASESTTITVTDSARGLMGTDTVSTVNPGAASTLALMVTPSGTITAGTGLSVTVSARDDFGNAATSYQGTVAFTSSDPQATLPAAQTFTAAEAGSTQLPVTLKTAATDQTVSVTDQVQGFLTATAHVQVIAAGGSRLVFVDPPTSGSVRENLGPVRVRVTDEFGNTASAPTPVIALSLAGGNAGAALLGTVTATPSAGIVDFADVRVDQQGTDFRLQAGGGSLSGAISAAFDVVDDKAPATAALSVSEKTNEQLRLSWTSVGDDGLAGHSTRYELRSSTSPIDASTFDAATLVGQGAALPQGSTQSVLVTSLTPDTQYYFALRINDDTGNASLVFAAPADTRTLADPCASFSLPPASPPTCAADGVNRITYSMACEVVDGIATAVESQTTTPCGGTDGVCFAGACETATLPSTNSLVVSEVMHSPSVGTTEYFELANLTGDLLDLQGLTVAYTNAGGTKRTFTVGTGTAALVVDRHGTFVVAQNMDLATNGGVAARAQYPSNVALDGVGSFQLTQGTTPVADFAYSTAFPQTPGKAMSLSSLVLGTGAEAHAWNWCDADAELTGGDFGTPGAANSTCGMTVTPPVEWCNIESPKTIASVGEGTPTTIRSRFREPGLTDRNLQGNDQSPFVIAELGYGPAPSAADTWTWSSIGFESAWSTTDDSDAMSGTLTIAAPGNYLYGFRYALQDPITGEISPWVYCDQSGVADAASGTFGTVAVGAPPPGIANHVVISEISGGNGSGTAATDEFIELYNPTSAPVDLSGWKVQYKSAAGASYSASVTLPAGTVIQPKRYLLLGGANYSGPVAKDVSYTFDTSASTTGGGHVRIGTPSMGTAVNDANEVDRVGWGTANAAEGSAAPSHPAVGGSLERKAVAGSTQSTMSTGGSDALRGNGYDTDNNQQDFVTRAVRDPQNSSSAAESP
ncbi:MAG: lamin tail domain-containing protein, partial [Myxococcaceae bacterium]